MDDIEKNAQLAVEMAAISAVKSQEIVSLARETSDLDRFQARLDESKDRVQLVKSVLSGTQPHQVTPEIARSMDNLLNRSIDVEIPAADGMDAVAGAEQLGHDLMPKDYLFTRLVGCENFLNDFFRKSREVILRMSAAAKESYILVTQTHDHLESSIETLEKSLQAAGAFESRDTILLGSRLFNLFKVNGKVSEDWAGDLGKVSRSVAGISNNYYLSSKNELNSFMSYFGGFSDADAESGLDRMLLMPSVITRPPFKECTYPNRALSNGSVVAKQSVELMGGAYFVDVRLAQQPPRKAANEEMVDDILRRHLESEYTGFENSSEFIMPRLDNAVKALSSGQIKAIVKHLRETLKEWRKTFEGGERLKMADVDFQEVSKGIYESSMPEEMKDRALTSFSSLVRNNQLELLNMHVAVNTYLVLVINGLVELCHDSIKINAVTE